MGVLDDGALLDFSLVLLTLRKLQFQAKNFITLFLLLASRLPLAKPKLSSSHSALVFQYIIRPVSQKQGNV
jgi:hypothetical protein